MDAALAKVESTGQLASLLVSHGSDWGAREHRLPFRAVDCLSLDRGSQRGSVPSFSRAASGRRRPAPIRSSSTSIRPRRRSRYPVRLRKVSRRLSSLVPDNRPCHTNSDVLIIGAVWFIRWRKHTFWLIRRVRSGTETYWLAHTSLLWSGLTAVMCCLLQGYIW